jgi:hypothetical protein
MDIRQWPACLDNAEFCRPELSFGEESRVMFWTQLQLPTENHSVIAKELGQCI